MPKVSTAPGWRHGFEEKDMGELHAYGFGFVGGQEYVHQQDAIARPVGNSVIFNKAISKKGEQ